MREYFWLVVVSILALTPSVTLYNWALNKYHIAEGPVE